MSLLNFPDFETTSESDVEQKFIYPLLTHPSFLDIPPKAILTKRSMGTMSFVDKSTLPKNYIPDYVLFFSGFPVCVIEAKSPEDSVDKAIAEARLYAQVLNSYFPSGTNPILLAIGCNGRELAMGNVDSVACNKYSCIDLTIGSKAYFELKKLAGLSTLSDYAKRIKKTLSPNQFSKPAQKIGGQYFLERVRPNALAPYLNPLYEMFFRAEDPEKIQLILDQAYVDTAELREYDQVLHSMMRHIERKKSTRYQTIQTDRKREYTLTPELERYGNEVDPQGRMHLIVGARGAGKSLFIARFFKHLISEDLKRRAAWAVIDFNRAPATIPNIENYICEKFLENVVNIKIDPYGMDGLNRVFSVELNRLKRGPFALISDPNELARAISQELLRLSSDTRVFALRLARYITGDADCPLIVAFDNVDRRDSALQLLIFQSAQWFRNETRAFTMLTLRDVTFERYKDEPPLDAFAQISNFYIRPPRFSLVLQKRLRLAIDVGLKDIQEIEQPSTSGIRFRYSKEQLSTFLQNVYDALFGNDQQVGRIVDALAESDVRDALGMFARILASGHFNADRVIGIGTGASSQINNDLLIKILMRSDYRLYSDNSGFIYNLFWAPQETFSGNIFLTAEVLGFFAQAGKSGADNIIGYWRLEELLSDLASMGFEEIEMRSCVVNLLNQKMLAYDGEGVGDPSDHDLIKITPSGFIHLRSLPYFIEYISSVALHAPVKDRSVADKIASSWAPATKYQDLTFGRKHEAAKIFSEYLGREKNRLDSANPLFRERSREAERIVVGITQIINSFNIRSPTTHAKTKSRVPRSRTAPRRR